MHLNAIDLLSSGGKCTDDAEATKEDRLLRTLAKKKWN